MELFYAAYALEFKYPFGLAHGSRTYTDVVYARLTQDGLSGYGEAALPPYLGETQSSVIAFFKKASETVKNCKLPFSVEEIVSKINLIETGNTAAKAALDIALYDLLGKFTNKPVYELLEIEKPQPKDTSVTISI
ncbi:MAG TPA: dipeptide epimerase, partial [Bacteroidia bacterium]|nr:dipeptide epimerase [Bacteroidia bacterium]